MPLSFSLMHPCKTCGNDWYDEEQSKKCCHCAQCGKPTRPRRAFCSKKCLLDAFNEEAAAFKRRNLYEYD